VPLIDTVVPPADGPEVLCTDVTAGRGWMMVSGIVASTVVVVLTFLLPLSVVTVSVAWTVIELEPPTSLELGVPDNTPAEDSASPLGRVTFFHFNCRDMLDTAQIGVPPNTG
jgi:hypothetical protein